MNELKQKLDTLCIFHELLRDAVLDGLYRYLESPEPAAYARFAAALYEANGGDLAAHIQTLCQNSSNVYVKTIGRGEQVPPHMQAALTAELQVLQQVAALDREALCTLMAYKGFLPDFTSSPVELQQWYLHRTEHIGRYGYGIYAQNPMFYVDEQGGIVPVGHPDPVSLESLVDYERERQIILENTRALLAGRPAANILLTGDAGTGKSSSVKAVVNKLWQEGLRLIQIRKDQLSVIPRILDVLSENPLKFVLFIDDLSFLQDDDSFNHLKCVLEGSATARSGNVVIYATANRRHIIRERFSDREGDEVHRNDTLQEQLSLSERFGIHITFSKPDKATYLRIVRQLAGEAGVTLPDDRLEQLAERFALERGGRSARLARQLVDRLRSEGEDHVF